MNLYVARHGQTNYNDLSLCNSDPSVDVHLTELGIKQSEKLAVDLKDIPFDVIYISELRRTKQTASYVNNFHEVEIIVDPRLNDNKTGFEGKPVKDYFKALKTEENSSSARLNDGESLQDVVDRVWDFLSDLKTRPYSTVLIITSQVIVQYIDGIIKQVPDVAGYELEVPKGSFMKLEL